MKDLDLSKLSFEDALVQLESIVRELKAEKSNLTMRLKLMKKPRL